MLQQRRVATEEKIEESTGVVSDTSRLIDDLVEAIAVHCCYEIHGWGRIGVGQVDVEVTHHHNVCMIGDIEGLNGGLQGVQVSVTSRGPVKHS